MVPLLEAALNGARTQAEHPAVPRTPAELAAESRAAVDAGARVLHLHPYDGSGAETLAADPCAAALRAVRLECPGVPVSLSTSADIEPDPSRRLELVAGWTELPELVTANQGETGILELCERLIAPAWASRPAFSNSRTRGALWPRGSLSAASGFWWSPWMRTPATLCGTPPPWSGCSAPRA
jgi:uncharacterized protein (DUF849 family)